MERLTVERPKFDPRIALGVEGWGDLLQVTTEEAAMLKAALIAADSVAWPD